MNLVASFMTNNPCYRANVNNQDSRYTLFQSSGPQGLMLHSIGCPQPSALVFLKNWTELRPDLDPGHPEGFLSLAVDAACDERGGVFSRPVIDFSQQDELSVLDADEVGAEGHHVVPVGGSFFDPGPGRFLERRAVEIFRPCQGPAFGRGGAGQGGQGQQ